MLGSLTGMTLPVSAQWVPAPGVLDVPAVASPPSDTSLIHPVATERGLLVEGGRAERCGDDWDGCLWGGQIQLAQQPADQPEVGVRIGRVLLPPGANWDIQLAGRSLVQGCSGGLLPEMVVLPGGTFRMGDLSGTAPQENQRPVHEVRIRRFAVSRCEVTQAQYQEFISATGRFWKKPRDFPDNGPAADMTWHDAQAFIEWLNRRTGQRYRLLTEAEWEYAARGGTETEYYSGDDFTSLQANCGNSVSCSGDRHSITAPVGSYPPNPFGLYDMAGNVWEWVEDCWHDSYEGAPVDGSAWVTGCDDSAGGTRRSPARGGSWGSTLPDQQRSAFRFRFTRTRSDSDLGFRLARDL